LDFLLFEPQRALNDAKTKSFLGSKKTPLAVVSLMLTAYLQKKEKVRVARNSELEGLFKAVCLCKVSNFTALLYNQSVVHLCFLRAWIKIA
jgi:hypothetical protein